MLSTFIIELRLIVGSFKRKKGISVDGSMGLNAKFMYVSELQEIIFFLIQNFL